MNLEPDRTTLEGWLATFSAAALDHLDRLPVAPSIGKVGAEGLAAAEVASLPIPEAAHAGGAPELAAHIVEAAEASLCAAGPGYMAYVPGGGIPSAGIAELVASWLNRFTGLSAAAPALCRLEADTLRWLASEFGYGPEARGIFTSGGSLANFSAVVTARHAKLGDEGDYRTARVYTSSQVHHSVSRSVGLAGIPPRNVRSIATDARLRMDPAALRSAIDEDRRAGLRPFLVVSSAGTTNTGAVDPLNAIADVCTQTELWHHVDGAYGGAFVLCAEGRARLEGIARADSITFDPHKGMFLPYGTGTLLVADGAALLAAHQAHAAYLQDFDRLDRRAEAPSPTDHGPELSRPFRGLRLWLPLQLHGAAAFREALREKLALAEALAQGIRRLIANGSPLELVDDPQLTVVPLRLARRHDEALAAWNLRNRAFCEAVNASGRVALSSTTLPVEGGAAFTIRACILSFRTHRDRVEAALEDIAAAAMRY